ncbi:uncharacterized protein LOC112451631 [Temnothorax curvispinosus]|uniref:Uncharacterized protein LOC112451631 n=1 Tax=Temnothorax curvispinosus TaxID=300111 RepID=A0A6J1PCD0_9HYME|nr:uncharacterized protein LOC112451631 [Temnothorax curvispinosus]
MYDVLCIIYSCSCLFSDGERVKRVRFATIKKLLRFVMRNGSRRRLFIVFRGAIEPSITSNTRSFLVNEVNDRGRDDATGVPCRVSRDRCILEIDVRAMAINRVRE